jgi:pantoate--beta-alanine ligase
METVTTVTELCGAVARARLGGIGFVPTMGYLHNGHRALLEASRAGCDVTVK